MLREEAIFLIRFDYNKLKIVWNGFLLYGTTFFTKGIMLSKNCNKMLNKKISVTNISQNMSGIPL